MLRVLEQGGLALADSLCGGVPTPLPEWLAGRDSAALGGETSATGAGCEYPSSSGLPEGASGRRPITVFAPIPPLP